MVRPERKRSPPIAAHGDGSQSGGRCLTRLLLLIGIAFFVVHVPRQVFQIPSLQSTSSGGGNLKTDGCKVKAAEANGAYLKQNLKRFWGNEPYIETLLELLGKEPLAKDWDIFIDVGAGAYSAAGGDISLSLLYDKVFPATVKRVFAFEPFKEAHGRLEYDYKGYLDDHPDRKDLQYNLFNKGVGRDEEPQGFRGNGNVMTANKRIALHRRYIAQESMTIESMSIQSLKLPHVNVLKTDTEGLEWEVLLGAKPLIKNKKMDMIFFAYEDKWTFDSFQAAYPITASGKDFVIKEQEDMDTPNLQSVSTWFDRMGYDSYLIGLAPAGQEGFVALPVTGDYWSNTFEVGRDPKSYGYDYTWMDAMAVQRGSPLQEWIEQQSQPHAKVCR